VLMVRALLFNKQLKERYYFISKETLIEDKTTEADRNHVKVVFHKVKLSNLHKGKLSTENQQKLELSHSQYNCFLNKHPFQKAKVFNNKCT